MATCINLLSSIHQKVKLVKGSDRGKGIFSGRSRGGSGGSTPSSIRPEGIFSTCQKPKLFQRRIASYYSTWSIKIYWIYWNIFLAFLGSSVKMFHAFWNKVWIPAPLQRKIPWYKIHWCYLVSILHNYNNKRYSLQFPLVKMQGLFKSDNCSKLIRDDKCNIWKTSILLIILVFGMHIYVHVLKAVYLIKVWYVIISQRKRADCACYFFFNDFQGRYQISMQQ